MSSIVLDASVILAVLHKEKGYQKVVPHLDGALISAVNYAEVLKKAVERDVDLLATQHMLERFGMLILPFEGRQAAETSRIWPLVQPLGLSFADRTCLALGLLHSKPVLTADRRIHEADLPVTIELIR